MMRLNSWMSFMFPTDLAVTCQLFCTAASIIAWRMENPERMKESYNGVFFSFKNLSVGIKSSTEYLFSLLGLCEPYLLWTVGLLITSALTFQTVSTSILH